MYLRSEKGSLLTGTKAEDQGKVSELEQIRIDFYLRSEGRSLLTGAKGEDQGKVGKLEQETRMDLLFKI